MGMPTGMGMNMGGAIPSIIDVVNPKRGGDGGGGGDMMSEGLISHVSRSFGSQKKSSQKTDSLGG